jgi:hypothetical protein
MNFRALAHSRQLNSTEVLLSVIDRDPCYSRASLKINLIATPCRSDSRKSGCLISGSKVSHVFANRWGLTVALEEQVLVPHAYIRGTRISVRLVECHGARSERASSACRIWGTRQTDPAIISGTLTC